MVGMFGDLLVDTEVSTTGCSCLCCIPALPLPNFGLSLSTCLFCIWGFCFSMGECVNIDFLVPCTLGNFTPAAIVCDHVCTKYLSIGSSL